MFCLIPNNSATEESTWCKSIITRESLKTLQKSKGFNCYPGRMCGTSLKKEGSRVIDRKRKGYRPYRLTGFFEGRYKKAESMIYVYPLY